MPPPQQQQQQQFLPQQGQPSVSQQQIPAIRPRPPIDLTSSDDERIPKRPRMASDPNVYTRRSPVSTNHPQHQVYAQMPAQTPYQQRNVQARSQVLAVDHIRNQPMQQHHPQRSGTAPTNMYQYAPPPTSPTYAHPYGANGLPNVPGPPTSVSAPPVMDAYKAVTGGLGPTQIHGRLPDAQVQTQGNGQPQQAYTDPAHSAILAETPTVRSMGTPLRSTPAAPPPDSAPVSPQAITGGQMQSGGSSLPPLTEEQIKQMRSELADSMFTEPKEGDETQARTCILCE